MKQKKFTLFLITFLLLLSGITAYIIFSGNAAKAVITVNGETIRQIDLSKNKKSYDIKLGGDYNVTLRVEKNEIYFKHSDCPDKICMNKGRLSKRGDTAVCMPAKTIVTVK